MRYLVALMICIFCLFGAAWAGYHLFYLAAGKGPIEIDEPNVWLARGEFLFSAIVALIGLGGFVYTVLKLRQGRCPLCGSNIDDNLPTRQRETAKTTDKTARIGGVHTAKFAVPTDGKGAADAQTH